MTNMIDWLNATSEYMARELPGSWDTDKARQWLTETYYRMEDEDRDFDESSTGAYSLERTVAYEDGIRVNVEYRLHRVIASAVFFPLDEEMYAVSWLEGSTELKPMALPTLEDQLPFE